MPHNQCVDIVAVLWVDCRFANNLLRAVRSRAVLRRKVDDSINPLFCAFAFAFAATIGGGGTVRLPKALPSPSPFLYDLHFSTNTTAIRCLSVPVSPTSLFDLECKIYCGITSRIVDKGMHLLYV